VHDTPSYFKGINLAGAGWVTCNPEQEFKIADSIRHAHSLHYKLYGVKAMVPFLDSGSDYPFDISPISVTLIL